MGKISLRLQKTEFQNLKWEQSSPKKKSRVQILQSKTLRVIGFYLSARFVFCVLDEGDTLNYITCLWVEGLFISSCFTLQFNFEFMNTTPKNDIKFNNEIVPNYLYTRNEVPTNSATKQHRKFSPVYVDFIFILHWLRNHNWS